MEELYLICRPRGCGVGDTKSIICIRTIGRRKEKKKVSLLSLSISQSHPTSAFTTSPFLFLSHYCGPLLLLIQRPTSKGNPPPPPPIAPCISSAESPPDMQCSSRRRGQSGGNCCGAITTCSRTAVEGGCCIRKRLEFDHFSRNRPRRTTIFNKKGASSTEQHNIFY